MQEIKEQIDFKRKSAADLIEMIKFQDEWHYSDVIGAENELMWRKGRSPKTSWSVPTFLKILGGIIGGLALTVFGILIGFSIIIALILGAITEIIGAF